MIHQHCTKRYEQHTVLVHHKLKSCSPSSTCVSLACLLQAIFFGVLLFTSAIQLRILSKVRYKVTNLTPCRNPLAMPMPAPVSN